MTGRFKFLSYSDKRKPQLTFEVDNYVAEALDNWKDKDLEIEVKVRKKKRSLDANAYAWVLIDKLAQATGVPKDELYRNYTRNVGGASMIICIKKDKADDFKRDWAKNGLGWQTDSFDSKFDGYINIICSEGSSVFDVDQMRQLTDQIKQDCDIYGIETRTPDEIENLLNLWSEKK